VFPAAILAMQRRHGHVTLGGCCQVLGMVLCGTLAAKLALEGWKSVPDYTVHGRRAAGVPGRPGILTHVLRLPTPRRFLLSE